MNKNYLGHEFIKYDKFNCGRDFICTKCNMAIDFRVLEQINGLIVDAYYILVPKHGLVVEATINCEITCEEYIIKNILE